MSATSYVRNQDAANSSDEGVTERGGVRGGAGGQGGRRAAE